LSCSPEQHSLTTQHHLQCTVATSSAYLSGSLSGVYDTFGSQEAQEALIAACAAAVSLPAKTKPRAHQSVSCELAIASSCYATSNACGTACVYMYVVLHAASLLDCLAFESECHVTGTHSHYYLHVSNGELQWVETAVLACPALQARVG
jgi:hypothetical protein